MVGFSFEPHVAESVADVARSGPNVMVPSVRENRRLGTERTVTTNTAPMLMASSAFTTARAAGVVIGGVNTPSFYSILVLWLFQRKDFFEKTTRRTRGHYPGTEHAVRPARAPPIRTHPLAPSTASHTAISPPGAAASDLVVARVPEARHFKGYFARPIFPNKKLARFESPGSPK